MKWFKNDDEILLKYFKEKKTYKEISKYLNRSERAVRARLNKLGYKYSDNVDISKKYVECICANPKCGKKFNKLLKEYKKSNNNKHFCSKSCANSFNNLNIARNKKDIIGSIQLIKNERYCLNCNKILKSYQKNRKNSIRYFHG